MRIAVIGNSHVAAIKTAWDEVTPDHPGVELTFFAVRNTDKRIAIADLRADGTTLVADTPRMADSLRTTSGGLDRIDTTRYDAYLLVGFPPRPFGLPPDSPYSAAVRAALYEAMRTHSPLAQLVATLRKAAPAAQVFVAAFPLLASPTASAAPDHAGYDTSVAAMIREAYAPMGVHYLPQPRATILAGKWTDPAYSRGSVRLHHRSKAPSNVKHPEADRIHMNAAYGKRALAEALPVIAAALETA